MKFLKYDLFKAITFLVLITLFAFLYLFFGDMATTTRYNWQHNSGLVIFGWLICAGAILFAFYRKSLLDKANLPFEVEDGWVTYAVAFSYLAGLCIAIIPLVKPMLH